MEKTTRSNLLRAAAAGGVAAAGLGVPPRPSARLPRSARVRRRASATTLRRHTSMTPAKCRVIGRRATVAFGQWDANPAAPLDRFPLSSDRTRNIHKLLPF